MITSLSNQIFVQRECDSRKFNSLNLESVQITSVCSVDKDHPLEFLRPFCYALFAPLQARSKFEKWDAIIANRLFMSKLS